MTREQAEAAIPVEALRLNDGSHGLPKNPRFIRKEFHAKE